MKILNSGHYIKPQQLRFASNVAVFKIKLITFFFFNNFNQSSSVFHFFDLCILY